MKDSDALLLLDDGELDALVELLERSSTPYRRMRGGEIPSHLESTSPLLIATPRHASKVRAKDASRPGDTSSVRIIVSEQDSPSMREMMRESGFHYLVRLPTHPEVWRLLIQRSLYDGSERRVEDRLPVGSKIQLQESPHSADPASPLHRALLVDLSNRGCHLVTSARLALDSSVSFRLPIEESVREGATVSGRVVRTTPIASKAHLDEDRHSCAVLFDIDLPEPSRMRIAEMINSRMTGPETLNPLEASKSSLPTAPSPDIPGLSLDNETDPPVSTDLEVDYCVAAMKADVESSDNRRSRRRVAFTSEVAIMNPNETHVLMGRDLSATGMRVEALPGLEVGARMRIALYGASGAEPIQLDAEITRDDGEGGLALRFDGVSRETSRALEKLVACLPAVESLEVGEAQGMGTVLSEILPR